MEKEKKYPKVGVGTIVMKDGKVLLGKRISNHGIGTYSVPGGHLEFFEEFEDGAARECFEETGIKVKNLRFEHATNNILENDGVHSITVFMKGEYAGGEATVTEPEKFVEVGWYDPHNLPEPLFLPLKLFLSQGHRLA